MQNRAYDRIHVQLEAMYHCGVKNNKGIVKNISENGLFIRTKMDFPFDINFDLIIPSSKGSLHFPVKINRLVKSDGEYNGIGLEIADQSETYLDYVNSLRTSMGSPG